MSLKIPIAHDFICPWCWVGLIQAKKLQQEFGAEIDWKGYELFPDELAWPTPSLTPAPEPPPNKPVVLTRFEFLLAADAMTLPKVDKPFRMRTHNAHEAVEYAKTVGVADPFVETLYRAYWEQGLPINEVDTLRKVALSIIPDVDALISAVEGRQFKDNIVGFDDDAYNSGVYNVPTFFIGDTRYAEQPYSALRDAVQKL